jgi:hypothetical protein
MWCKRARSAGSGAASRGASRSFKAAAKLIGVAAGVFLAGCARIPLPDAVATGPQISEVVTRVKCDLYDALVDRLNAPYGYEWLRTWTSQVSLNLIVQDQGQLNPGVMLTQPLGVVTIPNKVANFAQSFNMGLGAQLSETATRTENITFTVSMNELAEDFKHGRYNCNLPQYTELRSELGLKGWIAQSLHPADSGLLQIGYHKAPKATGGLGAAGAAKAISDANKVVGSATASLGPIKLKPVPSPECSRPPGYETGRAAIAMDLAVVTCDLFTFISGPTPPKTTPAEPGSTVPKATPPQSGSSGGGSSGGAQPDKPTPPPPYHDLTNPTVQTVQFVAKTIGDIQRTIRDAAILGETGREMREALERTATNLSVFVDPPIDVLSHQAQFIIITSASASPSWTLVNFKGPGAGSQSLASFQKTRTHGLNIVIGPPGSADVQGALLAFQTGTALTSALNSGAVTVVTH